MGVDVLAARGVSWGMALMVWTWQGQEKATIAWLHCVGQPDPQSVTVNFDAVRVVKSSGPHT